MSNSDSTNDVDNTSSSQTSDVLAGPSSLPAKHYQELQKQNETNSPMYIIPPEILSSIFRYACPDLAFTERFGLEGKQLRPTRRTQFDLSAVSTFWRDVTLSTPHLWASVDITIQPHTVNRASEILEAFIAGSGDLPISIGLDFLKDSKSSDDGSVEGPGDSHSPLPTFPEHSHRIQELHLKNPPESWVNDLASSYTNLTHFSIKSPPLFRDGTLALNFPCSHLTLWGTTSSIDSSWATITTLHLSDLQEDMCLRLLMGCVNVVEFRCRDPNSESLAFRISLPTSPFVLPHIKLFEWSVYSVASADRAMLEFIRMPSLETLVWVEEDIEKIDSFDPRYTFFDHLPSTLTSLHFSGSVYTVGYESAASDLIHRDVTIEHLYTRNCDFRTLNHLFDHLTIKERDPKRPIALPKLKAITITDSDSSPLEKVNLIALIGMAESRLRHRESTSSQPLFCLEIVLDGARLEWTSEFKEAMKELVRQGLELSVTEASVAVEWL